MGLSLFCLLSACVVLGSAITSQVVNLEDVRGLQTAGSNSSSIPIPPQFECIIELASFLMHPTSDAHIEMLRAMGKDFDDYGNYTKCHELELQEKATYVVLTINTTAIPIKLVFGLCLPRVCTKDMYDTVMTAITNLLNEYVPSIVVHISAADNLILPTSTYQMYVQLETQYQEDKKEERKSGAIVILVLVCLLFCLSVGSGTYEEYMERKKGDNPGGGKSLKRSQETLLERNEESEVISANMSHEVNPLAVRDEKYWSLVKSGRNSLHRQRSYLISQASTYFTEYSGSQLRGQGPSSVDSSAAPFEVRLEVQREEEVPEDRRITKIEEEGPAQVDLDNDPWYTLLLLSFSCKRNWNFLSEPRIEEEDGPELKLFDFVRTVSIIWVIALSTCFFICTASTYNPWTFFDLFKNIMFTVTVNAALAFDIFVAMSAMFSFYKIANFADSHGKVSPCFQYFMRLFRLVPLYYFVFFFGWMLVQVMGSGPLWSRYEMNYNQCNDYWWSVLLFVSNFFPWYRLNNEGCFFWSWAVCCDMQFFILIPPIVWLWRKWPKSTIIGLGLLASFNIGFYVYLFCTSLDMKAGIMAPQNQFLLMDIASKPYTKGASFVLGIYMGMFIYYAKEYQQLPQHHRAERAPIMHKLYESKNDTLWFVGYQLSLGMLLFLILIPFKANSSYWIWPQWCNALYLSFSRPLFIISVFFPFVAIYLGRLKSLKGLFGNDMFTPIGRLTYGMYLIHPLIICLLYITVDQSQYLRLLPVVGYFVSFVLLSVFVATLAFLVVEAPISHQFRGVLGVWCSRRSLKKN